MVHDFLRFLRPVSPLKDTPPRSRPKSGRSQANSERPSTIASLAKFCSMPLPLPTKRHEHTWSMGSLVLDPTATCYTPPGSVKQSKKRNVPRPIVCADRSSSYITESRSPLRPVSNLNQSAEQLRRMQTEPFQVDGFYKEAEMPKIGFWAKVNRIALTKREQASFNRLRRTADGPVSKADVLADCEPFVFHTDASTKQFDSGHKPLKLHQDRIGNSARNEYWEEDPFSGNIYVVRWVAENSPIGTDTLLRLSQRNDSRWSFKSLRTREEELAMHKNVDRISTIRIVEEVECDYR